LSGGAVFALSIRTVPLFLLVIFPGYGPVFIFPKENVMTRGSKNYGFHRLALVCAAAGIVGILLGGCLQLPGGNTQYTITFESHGGSAVAAITGNEGTTAAKPENPARTGYTFTGWFSGETGGTEYAWPHPLTADVTMHAQWQAVPQYTITFESHGGSAVAAITGNEGTEAAKPENPARTGYTFTGWFCVLPGGTE
jgi:uncharacterized repeat protein (TIGR02543 family)